MKAGSINLQKLFEQTIRYRIPLFQRPYVWTEKKNWQPIWSDVRGLVERLLRDGEVSPHFLGAIVLDQVLNQTGEIESRQVIDGQQRLTTLQLLLAAFRDLAASRGLEKIAKRFEKITVNDESFCGTDDDEFKVWPTNPDRRDFRRAMKAGSLAKVCSAYKIDPTARMEKPNIAAAYVYFYRTAEQWLDNPITDIHGNEAEATVDERFDALWTVMRSHLLLVAIDLEDDDDAQVIFETLNARGTQLLPADLVKNYLFQIAEKEGADLETLYAQYWKTFDSDFWRTEIRQGRLKRPRIDLFFQHFLTLKTLDEVPASHVFAHYKKYVESPTEVTAAEAHPDGKATYHLEQLRTYGKTFKSFLTCKPETRYGKFFERISTVDTATIYPLLLEAFHDLNEPNLRRELRQILRDVESFLVRRMICGLTTKNYNRLFLDMISGCKVDGRVSADAARKFLQKLEGDSVRWPNNKELKEAMLDRPLYRNLSQKKLRMLLVAFDQKCEDAQSEAVVYTDVKSFTIEHLMPQAWSEHWPLPTDEYPEDSEAELADWREGFIHTIGNLTLLTNKLNPSLQARNWEYKKPKILLKSKMNLNKFYFADLEEWNEDEIVERSKFLARLALRIWPYPKRVEPESQENSESDAVDDRTGEDS